MCCVEVNAYRLTAFLPPHAKDRHNVENCNIDVTENGNTRHKQQKKRHGKESKRTRPATRIQITQKAVSSISLFYSFDIFYVVPVFLCRVCVTIDVTQN